MIKLVNERTESARVAIRQIRREAIEGIEKLEKAKKISEDEKFRKDQEAQKVTESFSSQLEQIAKAKENEILQI